jgi:hypothetical protein
VTVCSGFVQQGTPYLSSKYPVEYIVVSINTKFDVDTLLEKPMGKETEDGILSPMLEARQSFGTLESRNDCSNSHKSVPVLPLVDNPVVS